MSVKQLKIYCDLSILIISLFWGIFGISHIVQACELPIETAEEFKNARSALPENWLEEYGSGKTANIDSNILKYFIETAVHQQKLRTSTASPYITIEESENYTAQILLPSRYKFFSSVNIEIINSKKELLNKGQWIYKILFRDSVPLTENDFLETHQLILSLKKKDISPPAFLPRSASTLDLRRANVQNVQSLILDQKTPCENESLAPEKKIKNPISRNVSVSDFFRKTPSKNVLNQQTPLLVAPSFSESVISTEFKDLLRIKKSTSGLLLPSEILNIKKNEKKNEN